MTLQQFAQLDKLQQQEAVKTAAVKLGEKLQPDFKYELYQLDDFYVEFKIEQPEGGELVGLQTFETFDQLEPYLEVMNIKT